VFHTVSIAIRLDIGCRPAKNQAEGKSSLVVVPGHRLAYPAARGFDDVRVKRTDILNEMKRRCAVNPFF